MSFMKILFYVNFGFYIAAIVRLIQGDISTINVMMVLLNGYATYSASKHLDTNEKTNSK